MLTFWGPVRCRYVQPRNHRIWERSIPGFSGLKMRPESRDCNPQSRFDNYGREFGPLGPHFLPTMFYRFKYGIF